ncbi:MAG: putative resolvase [Rhodospirillales bacterium]|nr:putative resolvase [Rhodospirillales bacterium]
MKALRGRTLRCAIYTRKSSEEGLEQDFNSLHAQREACEAYIKSQRHEGWVALPEAYDDGGISGGTMARPALQQLLAEITAGRIDVVVVYKVDRLTRSLADFAKIVEIFDARGVSFVSVTQQFNTTSSMGRLTLNVLLSFAQFEREVTGERIRDKIAASKKKGMWMGGIPPLGYTAKDHKLSIVDDEATTVRHIFARYVALGSVRLLKAELDVHGIVSKKVTSASGRQRGGVPIGRGALYALLRNRIYIGEIVHKEQHFPGEHASIVDRDLWQKAQTLLDGNTVDRADPGTRIPSLLAGVIFDSNGDRLTPTHAVKKGKRYRYYVSRPLLTQQREDGRGYRVPAAEIEELITERVCRLLADPAAMFEAIRAGQHDAAAQKRIIERGRDLAETWPNLLPARSRHILTTLLRRIEVHPDRVEIQILPSQLPALLIGPPVELRRAAEIADPEGPLDLCVPAQLKRAGMEVRMLIQGPHRAKAAPDQSLIRLIVKAHALREKLLQAGDARIGAIAEGEGLSGSYFARLLRLSYLSPEITSAILDGRQPATLNARKLMTDWDMPIDWSSQREALGFR